MTSTEIAIPGAGAEPERDIIDGWVVMASDVFKLAAHICGTDFVPAEYRDNAPAVAAAILTGRELGIGPMTSLRHVQVVKGRPSLSAEYKRARVLAAGHDLDIIELNTTRCKVVGRRKGKTLEITFTMDDAKRAELLNPSRSGKPGAWQTRPRRMLFARASTEVCDFMFTDITNGLPTTELLLEGTDDAFEGYDESPAQPAPAAPAAIEAAKPRTAQRKQRTQSTPPAQPQTPPAAAPPSPSTPAGAGGALPPLPGEDEPAPAAQGAAAAGAAPDDTDYDTPGTVTEPMITAIWTILNTRFSFTKDEKDQARAVCSHIAGRELASSAGLSKNEAKAVLDTLSHWQQQAQDKGEHPRDYLIAVMAAQEEESGGE